MNGFVKAKRLISVVGPTATGKTDLSLFLAKHFKTAILSCDSRQCYKELSIGTAKPSAFELQSIPHYFINTHSIHSKEVNVKFFADYAATAMEMLFEKHDVLLAVGGTGFFWESMFYDFNHIPVIPEPVREHIKMMYTAHGMTWLKQTLEEEDTLFTTQHTTNNPQRMMRALEVKRGTGQSILSFQQGRKRRENNFTPIDIGLKFLDAQDRLSQITQRTHSMIAHGLEHEVKELLPFFSLNALNTVGYKEWKPYFEGRSSQQEVIAQIIAHTNDYAKRQITWFKRSSSIAWFDRTQHKEKILEHITNQL